MKTSTKLMLAAGAVALGTTTLAGAGLADGHWRHGHASGHHGGHGRDGDHGRRMLEAFDANDDGSVTQAEIDEVRENRLVEFDQDDDGSLTLEEYQVLWLDAMHERMVDRFQDLDDDGDAIVTIEEFVAPYGRLAEHLDRDEDGGVTRDDLRHRDRDGDRDDSDERD